MNLLILSAQVLIFIKIIYCTRLSENVIPIHYILKLHPNIDNGTFIGEISIDLNVKSSTRNITLNSVDLILDEIIFNENLIKNYILQDEILCIMFNEEISEGNYNLKIYYNGELSNNGIGLARETYYNPDNSTTGYVIVNDFEPFSARRAFPCFDEPVFKATFSISITTPNDSYVALSNMPETCRNHTPMGVIYEFETTPRMSTYIVSLAVTNFQYVETIAMLQNRKIPIRIYTYKPNEANYKSALETIKRGVQYFSNYTNMSYPLPKFDFIEYNRTIHSVATENWGLVTIRIGVLNSLFKNYTKYQVDTILYHEVAHSWFGNTVTNEYFNDLWLQEAFATYFAFKAISFYEKRPIISNFYWLRHGVMELDSSSDSITVACRKNSLNEKCLDILNLFSDITYYKGNSILYTLNAIVGNEKFQKIIQVYLKEFQYSTANTDDFITVVEEVSKMNLRPFLESYLYQSTVPMLIAEKGDNGTYILKQKSSSNFDNSTYKWTIPVIYQTDKIDKSEIIWFNASMDQLIINEPCAKWIKFNTEEIGLYYVNYSLSLWNNLIQHIREIRGMKYLLSEVTYLYVLGHIDCNVIFKIISEMPKKGWSHVAMFHMELYCNLTPASEEFKKYVNFLNCHRSRTNCKQIKPVEHCEDFQNNNSQVLKCIDWIKNHKLDCDFLNNDIP